MFGNEKTSEQDEITHLFVILMTSLGRRWVHILLGSLERGAYTILVQTARLSGDQTRRQHILKKYNESQRDTITMKTRVKSRGSRLSNRDNTTRLTRDTTERMTKVAPTSIVIFFCRLLWCLRVLWLRVWLHCRSHLSCRG